mgnify:FL=1
MEIKFTYAGRKSLRYRLFYSGGEFKFPLPLRLDFTFEAPILKTAGITLSTLYPLHFFPLATVFSLEEILAEKIRALIMRGQGRDVFDLWFLLDRGIKLDKRLIQQKFNLVGRKYSPSLLSRSLAEFTPRDLSLDLDPFLPRGYRSLSGSLLEKVLHFIQ